MPGTGTPPPKKLQYDNKRLLLIGTNWDFLGGPVARTLGRPGLIPSLGTGSHVPQLMPSAAKIN